MFDPAVVTNLWNVWSGPLGAALTGASGWYGKVVYDRAQKRKDALSAGQQALDLIAQAHAQGEQLQRLLASYTTEIAGLRQRSWQIDDVVETVHAQALAARLMVHDLETKLGLEQTRFDPLPPYPVPVPRTDVSSDGPDASGAAAEAAPSHTHDARASHV